jgi:hypothetical protein
MKKNILFAAMLALAAPVLTSCSDEESEGKSRITTYPILEMVGDDFVKLNVGDSFNDPGCVATLGAEDITDQIMTSTNLDTSTPGFYSVVYKVVNADGFPATASRDIMVVDPNNFASTYFGESQYGTRHYYNAPINITKRSNGTYLLDDIAGGFYCYGRYPGYEPSYDFHLESVINLEADNTITLVAQGSWYWGIPITITSGTYDPTTGTITLVLDFDGDPMYVTLTK